MIKVENKMAAKNVKRGLGKGLDSIIPAKVTTKEKETKIEEKHKSAT